MLWLGCCSIGSMRTRIVGVIVFDYPFLNYFRLGMCVRSLKGGASCVVIVIIISISIITSVD